MTKEDKESLLQLIEKRKQDVLTANNVPEGDIQHSWISGIYNDIAECINLQF